MDNYTSWELAFTLLDKLAERLGPGQQVRWELAFTLLDKLGLPGGSPGRVLGISIHPS